MKHVWLNKSAGKALVLFFAGWSFDCKPFEFLTFDDLDVVVVYDYCQLNFDLSCDGYDEYYLVAWSMGVYMAAFLRDRLPRFERAIALNGTPYPIDNELGIPVRTFDLTLKYAAEGLKGKFYQNVFYDESQLQKYWDAPVERSVENRVFELQALKNLIAENPCSPQGFYDKAYVSMSDKIIPPKNQLNAWVKLNVPVIELADGHFPFYNFKSWKEICK